MELKTRNSKATKKSQSVNKSGAAINQLRTVSYVKEIRDRDLKALSYANNIARICIQILKDVTLQIGWHIRPEDPREAVDSYTDEINYLKNLLKYPNEDEGFRAVFSKVLEDILVFDKGVIEKVRNPKGWIAQLYDVPGQTIKSCYSKYGVLEDPAYKQYFAGDPSPVATFDKYDLLVFIKNPQNGQDIGRGKSPIEYIISSVVNLVQATNFNANYFNSAQIPPALANLKGSDQTTLVEIKEAFQAAMSRNSNAVIWTNADDIDFQILRPTNQDMQFTEMYDKLVQTVVSGFGLSIQDVGVLGDVNRATAEVQQNLSKNRGVKSIVSLLEDEINRDIIGDLAKFNPKFEGLVFKFEPIDQLDEKTRAEVDKVYIEAGVKDVNEVRTELGLLEREEELEEEEDILDIANRLDSLEKSINEDRSQVLSKAIEDFARRTVQPYEKKVNFGLLGGALDLAEQRIKNAFSDSVGKVQQDIKDQIITAVEKKNPKLAGQLVGLSLGDVIFQVRQAIQELQQITVAEAQNEFPDSSYDAESLNELIDINTQTNTQQAVQKANNDIRNLALAAVNNEYTPEQIVNGVNSTFENLKNVTIATLAAVLPLTTMNGTRRAYFGGVDNIVGYVYSAVLDSKTTKYCRSMDGKYFPVDDPSLPEITPPNHFRCRSILVPVTDEEASEYRLTPPATNPQGFATLPAFKDQDAFVKSYDELYAFRDSLLNG